MPAGVDFVCKNQECQHFDKGIVITAPWPMADINDIIDASNVARQKDFRETLLKLKSEGREYACITYPNVDELETESFRVHKWCPTCSCLWMYDAPVSKFTFPETISDVIEKADIPYTCVECETYLMDFNDIVEDGLTCPFCKKEMDKNTWFCNETTEETR